MVLYFREKQYFRKDFIQDDFFSERENSPISSEVGIKDIVQYEEIGTKVGMKDIVQYEIREDRNEAKVKDSRKIHHYFSESERSYQFRIEY